MAQELRQAGWNKARALVGGWAAWQEAAAAATSAAAATATLRPLKGRARPLAEKSLGTADPGATSLAMIFTVLGEHLARHAASPSAGVREEAEATV